MIYTVSLADKGARRYAGLLSRYKCLVFDGEIKQLSQTFQQAIA